MRSILLILAIFAIFVFASCHNDVPGLPSPDEVKFCKIEGLTCKSTYEISEADCNALKEKGKAELYSDKDCTIP
jgi:predicted nucleic acid binding AN1-type Zn finger protein